VSEGRAEPTHPTFWPNPLAVVTGGEGRGGKCEGQTVTENAKEIINSYSGMKLASPEN
jgi:hypothetical protein